MIQPILSPRQREIIRLLARGYTRREVAEVLEISFSTVRAHIEEAGRRVPGSAPLRRRLIDYVMATDPATRT